MKTTALRLYAKKDLRLEEFELPQMKNDEIDTFIIKTKEVNRPAGSSLLYFAL